jgi:hypothetical protein
VDLGITGPIMEGITIPDMSIPDIITTLEHTIIAPTTIITTIITIIIVGIVAGTIGGIEIEQSIRHPPAVWLTSGTFFLIGTMAAKYPSLTRMILEAAQRIGNHT